MDPMERLRSYVIERRAELRLSQRELAKVSGVNAATIASIEAGRVAKAPTIETLRGLEKGLRLARHTLDQVLAGNDSSLPAPGSVRALAVIDDLGQLAYPPTPEERRIIAEAEAMEVYFGMFTEPGFWNLPPEQRRRFLRDVESSLDEARDMYRRMGKEVPGHGA